MTITVSEQEYVRLHDETKCKAFFIPYKSFLEFGDVIGEGYWDLKICHQDNGATYPRKIKIMWDIEIGHDTRLYFVGAGKTLAGKNPDSEQKAGKALDVYDWDNFILALKKDQFFPPVRGVMIFINQIP